MVAVEPAKAPNFISLTVLGAHLTSQGLLALAS